MTTRRSIRGRATTAVAVTAMMLVAACGGGEEPAADGEAADRAEQQGPVVPPDSQATVSGMVSFEGTPPEPEAIDMSAEEACAAAYGDEGPTTQHVQVQDGGLANVFVHVKSELDRSFPAPSEAVELDQQDCRYRPHVLGVQTGQALAILNSDSLLHNINAQPEENRGFNISQPQAGMRTTREFTIPEVMIPVQCDVHGWMNAYVGVVDHPFHAVSAADGSYEITGLPPGEHVLQAWHERYGTMVDTVEVAAGGSAEAGFTYSADMAGAEVPLAEPLVVYHGPDGLETERGGR